MYEQMKALQENQLKSFDNGYRLKNIQIVKRLEDILNGRYKDADEVMVEVKLLKEELEV